MQQTYAQFCPIAMGADVFANRWTPLILRELLAGATQFNEIRRCMPRIPRSTLSQRLKDLEAAGVVVCSPADGGGYRLTAAGQALKPVVMALGQWGHQWTAKFEPGNLDAELLMWNLRRRLDLERLPPQPLCVQMEFEGLPESYQRARRFWLLIESGEAELCVHDPGKDVDLCVTADMAAFARFWLGELGFDELRRRGWVRLQGAPALKQAFPTWLLRSHFAGHGAHAAA